MKNLLSLLVLSALSFNVSANVFENKTDAAELATALVHCSSESANLLQGLEYVSSVETKHTEISKGVDVKTYVFKTAIPRGFGRTDAGPTLTVKAKVTQPPKGMMDAPARSEYNCSIK